MKRLLITLLAVGLFSSASAGIKVETQNAGIGWGTIADTAIWHSLTLDAIADDVLNIALDATADDVLDIAFTTGRIWSQPEQKSDPSTHYIGGLDTIITRHRIECDTTTVEKIIINDTTVIRLDVECDTIYRVEYRPVWKSKVKVFLEPGQLEHLLWLIKHYDDFELKKTYGQKE